MHGKDTGFIHRAFTLSEWPHWKTTMLKQPKSTLNIGQVSGEQNTQYRQNCIKKCPEYVSITHLWCNIHRQLSAQKKSLLQWPGFNSSLWSSYLSSCFPFCFQLSCKIKAKTASKDHYKEQKTRKYPENTSHVLFVTAYTHQGHRGLKPSWLRTSYQLITVHIETMCMSLDCGAKPK